MLNYQYSTLFYVATHYAIHDIRKKVYKDLLNIFPESKLSDWDLDIRVRTITSMGGKPLGIEVDVDGRYIG